MVDVRRCGHGAQSFCQWCLVEECFAAVLVTVFFAVALAMLVVLKVILVAVPVMEALFVLVVGVVVLVVVLVALA